MDRKQDRVIAFFLHDAPLGPPDAPQMRAALRGQTVQIRGDQFDALAKSGHCVSADDAPEVLPVSWPSDNIPPVRRRAQDQAAFVAGRAALIVDRRKQEEADEKAHRDALQKGHDDRRLVLERAGVESVEEGNQIETKRKKPKSK